MARGVSHKQRPGDQTTQRGRARRVPDEMVGRESPRSIPDSTAGIATWLDAGGLGSRGELTTEALVNMAMPLVINQICARDAAG